MKALPFREGRSPRRPIFLFVTGARNDKSDGTPMKTNIGQNAQAIRMDRFLVNRYALF